MKPLLTIAWERWKIIGTQIGGFNARLLMTLFYLTILLPFSLINTLTADPLKIKSTDLTHMRDERQPVGETLEAARRQF